MQQKRPTESYAQCRCKTCGKWLIRHYAEIRRCLRNNMEWPFCSRSCSVTYGNKKTPHGPLFKKNECSLEKNAAWKGGITRHKKGYVLRRAPDHPRAAHNHGYVFEHILVMEKILGRYLIDEEKIHHKNAIKDDNRPENLELWTSNHPTGARVQDLLDWARKFIHQYQ